MTASHTPSAGRLQRALRSPLLHFVAIGGLLHLAASMRASEEPRAELHIAAQRIAAIRDDWTRQARRRPSEDELGVLIDAHIDDELLVQRAYEFGWHRSDAIVQRRLLKNQRFLDPDSGKTDEALLALAYEQGMDRSDLVVRRRLIERMKLSIENEARSPAPSDEELIAWIETNEERFERPERIELTQIFLSRDQRGDALYADAAKLRDELSNSNIEPAAAPRYSDPFLRGPHIPLAPRRKLQSLLGPAFAEQAMDAPLEQWYGPVPSSYGAHVIWVHRRAAPEMPSLDSIRDQVRAEIVRSRERAALRARLDALRERRVIRIDSLAGLEP